MRSSLWGLLCESWAGDTNQRRSSAAATVCVWGVNLSLFGAHTVNAANQVIVRDPEILGGTPVFRGARVPFQALLDYLEGGQTLDEFLDDFPTVTREASVHALERAKNLLVSELG